MIFNKDLQGGTELRELLGFIDSSTNFDKWKTWIELSVRQITALTGNAVYTLADEHYKSTNYKFVATEELTEETTPKKSEAAAWAILDTLVQKIQLPNALFAYVRLLPSLDAGHSNSGRKKTLGEKDRALTAAEAYKDESNILNLAYEAMEDLLLFLEEQQVESWLASPVRKSTGNLLIPSLEIFNQYFKIDSARMYYTLLPMMRDVQDDIITPAVTTARVTLMLAAMAATTPTAEQKNLLTLIETYVRRPLALATISLALQRLPVDMLPDGIVQTQITGTIKEKLVANETTRKSLIATLDKTVELKMTALQEQITMLDGANMQERYVEPPQANENVKGFSF